MGYERVVIRKQVKQVYGTFDGQLRHFRGSSVE